MRFEKLMWFALAFILSSAAWEENSLTGGVSRTREYQATDGTSDIPPGP
jgi:hypothetical protein